MANTATRLIHLILLLQRQPNQKAADLAAQLDVSPRTLHRYMGMLEEMGLPVYTERGPYGGFSLTRGYKMPPLMLSPEEAAALALGAGLVEQLWGDLYQAEARSALAKLDQVLPEDQRQEVAWAHRSLAAANLHRTDTTALTPTLDMLRQGLHRQHRVRLTYVRQGSAEPTCRDFDAYALVHRAGWWYVMGFCHLRNAIRLLRVDRIRSVEILDVPYTVPPDFDVHAWLAQEPMPQAAVLARLHFEPQVADFVRENGYLWQDAAWQPDGSVIATLPANDLHYAAGMAGSFGPAVTVLDPPELRQLVAEWAQAVAQRYSSQAQSIPMKEKRKGSRNGKD
ncbi:MAG TPA: YafY family protein [Longilinea sp.]|nr:YafY family protein [Longilinea sp.]